MYLYLVEAERDKHIGKFVVIRQMETVAYYRKYLSHIHDTGFDYFAKGASIGIIEILQKNNIREGHIVDL